MVIALAIASPALAHDLAETSATLIIRDGGHLEVRLQVPWAEVLHAKWMPAVPMQEFLVRATNQPQAEFARELSMVERAVEEGTRVVVDGRGAVAFVRWQWPTAAMTQAALRRELMSRLAEGDRFEHASRLPAATELALGHEPATVRLQLPALLGPALLTVYRPAEQWLKPGQLSAPVAVRRASPP